MKNIIGNKIGRVIVIQQLDSIVDSDGRRRELFECKCDCGNILNIRGDLLKYQKRDFCCKDCLLKKQKEINTENLLGLKFGDLLVIEEGRKTSNDRVSWICKCICGNTLSVRAASLKSGKKTRCTICSNKIKSKDHLIDISNCIFGFLRVTGLNRIEKKNGAFWNVICDEKLGGCGNHIIVSRVALNSGQFSCGCTRESLIATLLKNHFKNAYLAEEEYKVLRNPETGYWLPYDIYIPSGKNKELNGFYIEIHGIQHYKFVEFWHKTKEKFEYNKRLDKIKKRFAKKNGTYIEIDLRKIKTVEEAVEHVKKFAKITSEEEN